MKKSLLFTISLIFTMVIAAQDNPSTQKQTLSNRSNDHFLVQLGLAGWNNIPDTINKSGLSKSFNVYFMFDFPFKTNPKLSMAFGPGIASDHILFKKTNVGIKDNVSSLYFTDMADTNHFKKTKLATVYLEAPIEFRYSANPYTGKGLKLALGVKVGTMLNAHTRNTKYENKDGKALNDYVMKESSKKFFNKTRLSGMIRVGYNHITLFGTYQFTPLFAEGKGPKVNPFTIGITFSGL